MVRHPSKTMKKALLALCAAATAVGAGASAQAGPVFVQPAGFYGPVGFGGGFYGPRRFRHAGFYGPGFRRGFYGPRRFRRRGLSGAEAALIATGIIGGVILIDRAIERDRRASRRIDDYRPYRGYDGPRPYEYERRRLEDERRRLEDERRRLEDERRDFEIERRRFDDDARQSDRRFDDRDFRSRGAPEDLRPQGERGRDPSDPNDVELLGGPEASLISAAFRTCSSETRAAAAQERLMLALPSEPGDVQELENGAVRMTASFTAQDPAGGQYERVMECDADREGVRWLRII